MPSEGDEDRGHAGSRGSLAADTNDLQELSKTHKTTKKAHDLAAALWYAGEVIEGGRASERFSNRARVPDREGTSRAVMGFVVPLCQRGSAIALVETPARNC
ncbi:hypothetical protein ASC97_30225 [Rhizobium sp. Root1203]|nr:hypothetical protein ASC97_30225 [Rhizobium sp. Root1203]